MHDLKKNANTTRSRKDTLKPECKDMCPDDEFNLRVKNNLVNVLEKKIIKYGAFVFVLLIVEWSRSNFFSCDFRSV